MLTHWRGPALLVATMNKEEGRDARNAVGNSISYIFKAEKDVGM